MGRQRRHRQRPVALARGVRGVEVGDRQAEPAGVAAHLVEGRQPQVAVEGRVLDALGHDRPAGLLEPGHELLRRLAGRPLGQHQAAYDLDLGGPAREQGQRLPDGVVHVRARRRVGWSGRRQVGPVDAEAGQHLDQRLPQPAPREVPARARAGTQADLDEPVHLRRQHLGQHQPLGAGDHLLVGIGGPGQRLPQRRQRGLAGRVDEHAEHVVEHVVPGGPGGLPVGGQRLTGLEDLLHDDPGPAGRRRQVLEVAARVGQAVRVVDAQPVHDPVADVGKQQLVRRGEDRRHLDPDTGQRRHVEEPAVVELVGRDPPRAQPVVLALQRRQHVALDAGPGRDRHLVVDVADPVLEQLQVPHDLGEGGAEHRHQDPTGVVGAVPVDVEPVGVRRLAAQLQQRPPRRVLRLRRADGHVVRHHVEHDAQARRAARRDHPVEGRLAPELEVEHRVVDDVVAVRRAEGGLQVRRAVQVRDAEVGEVARGRGGVVEPEAGVVGGGRSQLHPVGGDGHGAAG